MRRKLLRLSSNCSLMRQQLTTIANIVAEKTEKMQKVREKITVARRVVIVLKGSYSYKTFSR
jgi:hypothetical protein